MCQDSPMVREYCAHASPRAKEREQRDRGKLRRIEEACCNIKGRSRHTHAFRFHTLALPSRDLQSQLGSTREGFLDLTAEIGSKLAHRLSLLQSTKP